MSPAPRSPENVPVIWPSSARSVTWIDDAALRGADASAPTFRRSAVAAVAGLASSSHPVGSRISRPSTNTRFTLASFSNSGLSLTIDVRDLAALERAELPVDAEDARRCQCRGAQRIVGGEPVLDGLADAGEKVAGLARAADERERDAGSSPAPPEWSARAGGRGSRAAAGPRDRPCRPARPATSPRRAQARPSARSQPLRSPAARRRARSGTLSSRASACARRIIVRRVGDEDHRQLAAQHRTRAPRARDCPADAASPPARAS